MTEAQSLPRRRREEDRPRADEYNAASSATVELGTRDKKG